MRILRWLAVAAIAVGLDLSARPADPPPRSPMHANGFTVLAADFHVHGFPDGIPPWDAAREARRRRLDVIALTSHNTRFGWWLWTHGPRAHAPGDVIVLPGEELTSVGYHLALVGVTERVSWRQSMTAAAAAAHAQGAVAILAHPAGKALERTLTDDALRALDGVEVAHPGMELDEKVRKSYRSVFDRAAALHPHVAAIGSSDFHYFRPIGLCRTFVFAHAATAADVLDAVRAGRTVACDARGNVYGPAELATLVRDRCRDDAALAPPSDSVMTRLATIVIWAGVLALVIAGGGQT